MNEDKIAQIRKMNYADIPEALKLCNEIREHHRDVLNGYFCPLDYQSEQLMLENMLSCADAIALVASYDNKVVGLLLAEIRNTVWLEAPAVCQLTLLVVNKNFRKQGIASLLMHEFLANCHERKIDEIKLGVFNANREAYDFYCHCGFLPLEQRMSLKLKKEKDD